MEFLTHSQWPFIRSGMLAIWIFTFCCTPTPNKNKRPEEQVTKPPVIKKPPSSFDDTVIITSRTAVFYNPDSLQLVKIESVNEKRVYETMAHDCYYMMQNARNVIREHWPRIRIVEVIKARYLLFVKKDKSKLCIDLNAKNNICGLFLFDPYKDPEPVDMPNIDTFLGFYFGQ